MGLVIDTSGNAPSRDGAVHLFTSPELLDKSWFNRSQKAIFVNGMLNDGESHRKMALALSLMLACPVTGVLNNSDGFWLDLGQCITDKAKFDLTTPTMMHRPLIGFELWDILVTSGLESARKSNASLSRVDYVRRLIQSNPATAALYDLLQEPGYSSPSVPIFSHSQGNLVTSNALTALALAKGKQVNVGRVVYSYGSPCRFWPEGLNRTNHAFTIDPVSFLDLRVDWSSSKVGFKVAHGFEEYMKHDPEFVINRFRTGGCGMTFNMNEEELAKALVDMGDNVERLYKVFTRLKEAHWSDADDVVCYYVEKLQTPTGQSTLRKMAKAKPDFVKLLVKILDSGITTSQERKHITQLNGFLS